MTTGAYALLLLLVLACFFSGVVGYHNKRNRIGKVLVPMYWATFVLLLFGLPLAIVGWPR